MMIRLWEIFWTFLKVGIFAYGGGPSMIPLMQAEVVDGRKWMNITEFADVLALGNGLPGPITTKMALAIGFRVEGYSGAASALLGLLIPSSILMLIVILFFMSYKDSPRVKSMLSGLRPAVMALLFVTAYDVGKSSMNSPAAIVIGVVTFFVFAFTNLHPAIGMAISGLIGILFL
jgi:chromate transporter